MKYTILCLSIFLGLLTHAQPGQMFLGAALETDVDVYDFGEVSQTNKGEYIYAEIEVKNVGQSPLIISKCKGSCGCTTPECSNAPIPSNNSYKIKIKYDSNRVGPFNKTVTIYSNAENEPEKIIRIKGTVIASN